MLYIALPCSLASAMQYVDKAALWRLHQDGCYLEEAKNNKQHVFGAEARPPILGGAASRQAPDPSCKHMFGL